MGVQKDVLVWSVSDISGTALSGRTLNGTFQVTGAPDLMAFKDNGGDELPTDFDPVDPNQTLAGTLEGTRYDGNSGDDGQGTLDVFEFEYAFQVTDGTNTFNIYEIDNSNAAYAGSTTAYVSERVLEPDTTYTIVAVDSAPNNASNGQGTNQINFNYNDLVGQVDGTSGDDVIGTGFTDDDSDTIGAAGASQNDYILGEGGNDTINSGAGDDTIYGDDLVDIPTGSTEYVVQALVRDFSYQSLTGSPAFNHVGGTDGQHSYEVTGSPLEVRFIDNDTTADGDGFSNERPNDLDQRVEINGVLFNYAIDYQHRYTAVENGVTVEYNFYVVDVDRDKDGVIDLGSPTSNSFDTDYENTQLLIPVPDPVTGAVRFPPDGATLSSVENGIKADGNDTLSYAQIGATEVTRYDDTINAGADDDTVFGGQGNDVIDGGTGDDTISGGTGSDTIQLNDGFGTDTIDGGEDADGLDIDVVDASGITTGGVTVTTNNESGTLTEGSNNASFDNIESFVLTDQVDSFTTTGTDPVIVDGQGGDDTLTGGDGDDTITGGAGNDTITGGAGDDTLIGGDGNDTFLFGDNFGNDTVDGGNVGDQDTVDFSGVTTGGVDVTFSQSEDGTATVGTNDVTFNNIEGVTGTAQDDVIDASADNSGLTLDGGAGNDTITGGGGDDIIDGGTGDDTITGGAGDDTLTGGDGTDTFVYSAGDGADTITDFNTANAGDGDLTNDDNVDLTAFYNDTTRAAIAAAGGEEFGNNLGMLRQDAADGTLDGIINGVDYSAQIGDINLQLQNGGTAVTGSDLTAENTSVICFTKGTLIETKTGEVPVETLSQGDLVLTMDKGYQPVRWIGARHIAGADLAAQSNLRPVRIQAGALGEGLPRTDLTVSPQHRMLVRSKIAQKMFGQDEILVAAKHLVMIDGIDIVDDADGVTYVHFLCDDHEVVFANGAPSETLYTGSEALKSVSDAAKSEIFAIFPELADIDYKALSARPLANGRKGRQLAVRHKNNAKPLLALH